MVLPTCPICKAQDWDRGYVDTSADSIKGLVTGVYYTSFNKKFVASGLNLEADVCLNCGHVVLYVERDRLKKGLKKK